MAQQDTGLGWSAEGEWLLSTESVEVGSSRTINAPDFPNQPAPFVAGSGTWAERASVGMVALDFYWSGTFYQYKITRRTDAPVFLCLIDRGSYKDFFIISTVRAATLDHLYYNPAAGSYSRTGSFGATYSQDSTTGLYYTGGGSPSSVELSGTEYIPTFSSESAALAAINVAVNTFYKENAGYAVVCVAKWKTSNGTELISPILISSNTEFVDMTSTGTGNYMAKFNGLLSGVRFYMAFWDIPGNTTFTTSFRQIDLTDRGNMDLEQLFMTIISTSYAHVIIINSPDPYEQQTGSSEEEGGDGEDIVDDDVDFTPLPSSMAVASGFITLFCPSQYELNQLANYMWSPLFDVDTFKKLFANPMDCILGLAVYPFPISASGTKTVSVGGIATTVSMGYTLQQYHIVDCGSVYVPKQWGAYMDYAPYTRFNIFLPYIGFRSVSADDIMGKTISLRYMVDILSGACNAELKCSSTVLYSWAGSCAAQIPITGNDWRSAITAGISIAGSVAATVLTQGASAPMIAGTVASAAVNSMQLKPEVQRSGSISGSSGFLAGQRPYLVRTNPRSAIPANQNKYSGYPSFVTILLGSLTGYNEVYSVHLENIPATGAELDEIESILKGGAIF